MATCYRHSDRETGVSCSNCGNPICPDCMTPTPVGMRCPECARQRPRDKVAATVQRRTMPGGGSGTDVTRALIAVNVVVFLAELATGSGGLSGTAGSVLDRGALQGDQIANQHEYWRLVTGGFLHAGLLHIGFNMYLLWILGQMLEPAIGSVRFAAVYVVSLLAGSCGALIAQPHATTVGASGAVFGLMGAAFVELRARGVDPFQAGIGGLIVLNLAISFLIPGISVGGHIGGLAGGALAGLAFNYGDRVRALWAGMAACVVLSAAAIAGALAAAGG
jgi:membrane associated rhomboid family serine protease